MRLFSILIFILHTSLVVCQSHDHLNWCRINCDPEIHKENKHLIYGATQDEAVLESLDKAATLRFPLRFVYVDAVQTDIDLKRRNDINETINNLNTEFESTNFHFYQDKIESITSELKLEDLSGNEENIYDHFSMRYDAEDVITIFILDHKNEFCTFSPRGISCSRTGGFSYILSERTNNIVMSEFDIRNSKTVAHELGHFFGLYHTFEESLFGRESFDPSQCHVTGDLICDTPPDPGTVFEIYVNYSICEMIGLEDRNGNEFKPSLHNIMSYYKPCYLVENTFSKQQETIMQLAGRLEMRKRFSRPL